NAVERPNAQAACQRDDHIASMQINGRLKWQTSTGYGKRALVETAIGRYKGVIGPRLRARSFIAQQTEAAIGVALLNRMLASGRPKSVRCPASAGATK
ncbi:IS5/IS1182 family transposase, partial [Agrobacterium rhizogenes]|nr:IS5/IS1182 family transposase [Rhizobium rhizogenes]